LTAFRDLLARSGHTLDIRTWPPSLHGWLRLPRTLRGTDAVIIQRKLLAPWQLFLLRRAGRRLIFDFDDAVVLRDSYSPKGPHCRRRLRRFAATMRAVDAVSAGNTFLAEQAAQWTRNASLHVIPTCVDLTRYSEPPGSSRRPDDVTTGINPVTHPTLVWIGSASTLRGLEMLRPALEEAGRRVRGLRLKIIADRFLEFANVEVIRCPWSEATESAEIRACDIGISWLPDDLWSRGKCGLKILQYMAAGLPVVTNAVGVHPELVRHGETGLLVDDHAGFVEAIVQLANDGEARARLGAAGRRIVAERYSIEAGAAAWNELLAAIGTPASSATV
jgi:glycosyltransferase involved in cell wall biosynthesis